MAQQTTNQYRRSLAGSIGAGMKSVMGAGGRRYYVLEHKVSSKYHKAGENQIIIVDQIELGRAPSCQVRFDESFTTVSRRHAAIVKDGDNWKLVQLSKTNSTYLNGHRVETEWYLQNGDEIQLSTNGPRMGFIVPEGTKGLVKSIGLTSRLNLFRKQALRPYKTAITTLACVLVLCVAGATWKISTLDNQLQQKTQEIAGLIEQNSTNQQKAEQLTQELIATNKKIEGYEERLSQMAQETREAKEQARRAREEASRAKVGGGGGSVPSGALKEQCFPYTYAIYQLKTVITQPNGEVQVDDEPSGPVGTGFLLSNGKFVTARHVTETWYYYYANWGDERISNFLMMENAIVHNGGDIEVTFLAISNSGDQIQFTNKQCNADRSGDAAATATLENGMTVALKKSEVDAADWVTVNTSKSGLPFDADLSTKLPIGTNLQILGFPYGRGGEDPSAPSPISSHAEVARDGLDVNGTIMTSNDDTQSGNSGGPVFVWENDTYTVVGILSGSTLEKGRVVPISVIR